MAAYDHRYGPQQQPALMQQHLQEPNYSGDVAPSAYSLYEQDQQTAMNGHSANGQATQVQMYSGQMPQGSALYDPDEHQRHPTHDSGYGNGQTYSTNGTAMPVAPPPSKYAQPMQHPHNEPNYGPYQSTDFVQSSPKRLSSKWRKRLYWMIPLAIVGVALVILFEVYKDDFLRWARPLEDWLRERQDWSWIIPVAILFILSFPPLFGHEIVQLIVGLVYPIGAYGSVGPGGRSGHKLTLWQYTRRRSGHRYRRSYIRRSGLLPAVQVWLHQLRQEKVRQGHQVGDRCSRVAARRVQGRHDHSLLYHSAA